MAYAEDRGKSKKRSEEIKLQQMADKTALFDGTILAYSVAKLRKLGGNASLMEKICTSSQT